MLWFKKKKQSYSDNMSRHIIYNCHIFRASGADSNGVYQICDDVNNFHGRRCISCGMIQHYGHRFGSNKHAGFERVPKCKFAVDKTPWGYNDSDNAFVESDSDSDL